MGGDPFASVTAERGFLPALDPLPRLTLPGAEAYEALLDAVPNLSLSGPGRIAAAVDQLPPFPLPALGLSAADAPALPLPAAALGAAGAASAEPGTVAGRADAAELWRAYMVLSFLAHAFMWCDGLPQPPAVLPATLAVPWALVSHALGMPPVLTYATYNLLNWARLDAGGPAALGNIICLNNFLGTLPDEPWFRLVHVTIEGQAAAALAALAPMQAAAERGDLEGVLQGLEAMHAALEAIQRTLARMVEKCDPAIYFSRVRLPMSGWRGNDALPAGLVYAGVWEAPVQLYGETGAQSGILAAFDAALGVEQQAGWLKDYLDVMLLHMPPAHRRFVRDIRAATARAAAAGASVRHAVAAPGGEGVAAAYDGVLGAMEAFRTQHRAFANAYIAKHTKNEKGTGGSDFMPALAGFRDATAAHRLGPRQ